MLLTIVLSIDLWSGNCAIDHVICVLFELAVTPLAFAVVASLVTIISVRRRTRWMRNAAIVTLSPLGLILITLLSSYIAQWRSGVAAQTELDRLDAMHVVALEFRTWDRDERRHEQQVTGAENIESIVNVLKTAAVRNGHMCGPRTELIVVERGGDRYTFKLRPGSHDLYEFGLRGRLFQVDKRDLLAALTGAGVGERFAPRDWSHWERMFLEQATDSKAGTR